MVRKLGKALLGHINKYNRYYLSALLLLVILVGLYLINTGAIVDSSNIIRYYGFVFAVLSILYGSIQFKSNHDWSRRHFAMTASKEIKEGLNKHVDILDEKFHYIHRKKKDPITVDEIHHAICEKCEDGKLKKDDKDRLILDNDEKAKEVRKAIYHILNSYEYLAAGINQGVFDEEIIRSLSEGPIIKVYHIFRDYIDHVNEDMRPERSGKIWGNLKDVALDFSGDRDRQSRKRNAAG